jgi:hypothetical protein
VPRAGGTLEKLDAGEVSYHKRFSFVDTRFMLHDSRKTSIEKRELSMTIARILP